MIDDESGRCYLAALRILNHRWNSASELRRKLQAKRFAAEVVDATLARLTEEKWLDDQRYAAAAVRERVRRGTGRRRIAGALSAAGVDRQTAARAIAENVDEAAEREAVRSQCAKRIRHLSRKHGLEWVRAPEGRKNLAAWLLKQGYDGALVSEAIKELTGDSADMPETEA